MPRQATQTVIADAMLRPSSASLGSRGAERAHVLVAVICALLAIASAPAALLTGGALAAAIELPTAQKPPAPPTEWEVKAAWLYKFGTYVRWPKEVLPEDKSPLIVGVLGRDPFGKALDDTLREKSLGSHPIVVRRYESVDEASASHILYVSSADKEQLRTIIDAVARKSILLVGEGATFAECGGAITFKLESKRLSFAINTTATKAAQLEVSSQLLKLSKKLESDSAK